MTKLKVGDIVKILPLKGNPIDGVWIDEKMRGCVGETHIVTSANDCYVMIDDKNNYHWPHSVFEVVSIDEGDERYTPYFCDTTRCFPVHFDSDQRHWVDDKGSAYHSYKVGLLKKTDYVLQFPIFNVGEQGDVVSAIRFRNKTYLDHCYLPMTGRIDVEQESLAF